MLATLTKYNHVITLMDHVCPNVNDFPFCCLLVQVVVDGFYVTDGKTFLKADYSLFKGILLKSLCLYSLYIFILRMKTARLRHSIADAHLNIHT